MVDSKNKWKAWLYLSPALILLAVFTVWPIFNTVRIAFLQYYDGAGVSKPYDFLAEQGMIKEYGSATFHITLDNFKQVLGYKEFGVCLKNTILLCVLTVGLPIMICELALGRATRRGAIGAFEFFTPKRSFALDAFDIDHIRKLESAVVIYRASVAGELTARIHCEQSVFNGYIDHFRVGSGDLEYDLHSAIFFDNVHCRTDFHCIFRHGDTFFFFHFKNSFCYIQLTLTV